MSDVIDFNNPRALATVAVAMTAVAIGASYLFFSKESSSTSNAEPLSEESTVTIMRELAAEVQKIAMALSKKEELWRREAQRNNQRLDEGSLKDLLVGEIHKGVALAENTIYAKYDVVQAQVEVSCCETYKDHPVIKKATQDIKKILEIGNEPDLTDFTIEKTMAVMEDMMEGMTKTLEESCATVKAKMGDLNTAVAQKEINRLYVQLFPALNDEVHKKHDCNKASLEAALLKYQSDPAFNVRMQELSKDQKERLDACGVQLGR